MFRSLWKLDGDGPDAAAPATESPVSRIYRATVELGGVAVVAIACQHVVARLVG
jgi:hypothetical protein